MSVEYAKVRQQFGKPIGSFQAVKHRCADMAVRAEVARSATTYAAVAVRDAAPDADFQTAVAKVLCGDAYLKNAADNVQNHGGMGFTWECDAHLFVKRSRAFDASVGSRRSQLDALVAQFRAA
jgi:alkylation response protein AidB-like acyl-CoA dehydrogenase